MKTVLNNAEALHQAVAGQYDRVARQPEGAHPFAVGRAFAEGLGYPADLLDSLPAAAVAAFTGISYPLASAELQPGETVLDVGCGAGMDTILAARQVGPTGQVIGLDLAPAMVERAQATVAEAGLTQVEIRLGLAEAIPLEEETVDAVIVNGIFNLCPGKEAVAAEIWRVLKPGGRLLVSEIFLQIPDAEAASFPTCSLLDNNAPEEALAQWFS